MANEELSGEASAPFRGQLAIATELGINLDAGGQQVQDSRPERLKRSLEGLLKRLKVEAVDLYCLEIARKGSTTSFHLVFPGGYPRCHALQGISGK